MKQWVFPTISLGSEKGGVKDGSTAYIVCLEDNF
jgi:hypothetical protein